ncbi:MAG TPA: hypothetical protein VKQ36_06310, partial [Ktedonobacterales bacterium]|nr:hypothetical protein [Ktedonobacterales bacterium]
MIEDSLVPTGLRAGAATPEHGERGAWSAQSDDGLQGARARDGGDSSGHVSHPASVPAGSRRRGQGSAAQEGGGTQRAPVARLTSSPLSISDTRPPQRAGSQTLAALFARMKQFTARAYPWVAPWVYRAWLVMMTAALGYALFWLQSLLGAVPAHPTVWQRGVQWAELIWLAPVPLAVALWLGWFIYAEVPRRDPV